ncbi:alpha/beta fold hydrolase [Streptomyces sp. NPDC052013]|uniref:alpha/beta fold hydrolase n=1 Tax=unclassified Streptomyces TaxID=2593676 RepID=UPI0034508E95
MPPLLAHRDEGEAGGSSALPLVLVHGHPFDHTMWAPQLSAFSPGRRVITPDLRGYGASPAAHGVTSMSAFAQDIEELLDTLHVGQCVLGGLSMGGQIVMEYCARYPERVRGVLLADTFAAPETPEGRTARNDMADRLLREGMRGYADEVLHKMVAPHAPQSVAAHVHRMMTATDPQGAAAALRGRAERPDYRPVLTRLAVPALVVVGAEDEYTPVRDARTMHDLLPDSTLVVIDGAAHMPNLERPDEFNTALADFLHRCDASAARPV